MPGKDGGYEHVKKRIINALAVTAISGIASCLLLCVLFGPGYMCVPHVVVPLWITMLGVAVPVYYFACQARRLLLSRRDAAADTTSSRTAGRRVAVALLSLLLLMLAVFSGMLLQMDCVGLQQRLECGRAYRTYATLKAVEMACAKVLEDADKMRLRDLLAAPGAPTPETASSSASWNEAIPELMRKGRDADLPLDPEVRKKLGPGYMDIGLDAWGRPFEFSEATRPDRLIAMRSLGRDGIPSADDILPHNYPYNSEVEFYDAAAVNRALFARLYSLLYGQPWLQDTEGWQGRPVAD